MILLRGEGALSKKLFNLSPVLKKMMQLKRVTDEDLGAESPAAGFKRSYFEVKSSK